VIYGYVKGILKFLNIWVISELWLMSRARIYRKKEEPRVPCPALSEDEQAIRDLNHALHLQPKHAAAYSYRGQHDYKQGDYEQAIADYTTALELDPKCLSPCVISQMTFSGYLQATPNSLIRYIR